MRPPDKDKRKPGDDGNKTDRDETAGVMVGEQAGAVGQQARLIARIREIVPELIHCKYSN